MLYSCPVIARASCRLRQGRLACMGMQPSLASVGQSRGRATACLEGDTVPTSPEAHCREVLSCVMRRT
jgi:hypothetical protein